MDWLNFVLLLVATLALVISNTSSVEWKVDRVACRYTDACAEAFCNVSRPNRKTKLISVGCNLTRTLHNIHARLRLFYRYNQYRPFLLDASADVCDFYGPRRLVQPIMNVMVPYVMLWSNFNHSCPYSGYMLLKEFRLDHNLFAGSLLPRGQYRADLQGIEVTPEKNSTFFLLQFYFSVSGGTSTVDMEMG